MYWGGAFFAKKKDKMENYQNSNPRKAQAENIKKLTIVAMRASAAILILGIGIFFIAYRASFTDYDPQWVNVFGGGCIVYGLFRLWRAYQDYQTPIEETE